MRLIKTKPKLLQTKKPSLYGRILPTFLPPFTARNPSKIDMKEMRRTMRITVSRAFSLTNEMSCYFDTRKLQVGGFPTTMEPGVSIQHSSGQRMYHTMFLSVKRSKRLQIPEWSEGTKEAGNRGCKLLFFLAYQITKSLTNRQTFNLPLSKREMLPKKSIKEHMKSMQQQFE